MRRQSLEILHLLLEVFHPLHFVAGMGIGISSNIMYNFPINSIRRGIKYVGIVYYFVTLIVVILTHGLFILKYIVFPQIYQNDKRYKKNMFDLMHENEVSIFLGPSSMSCTTLINGLFLMKPEWKFGIFVLWWINFCQALSCTFLVFFFTMTFATRYNKEDIENHGHGNGSRSGEYKSNLRNIEPSSILPLVTCTVTSASGGLITTGFEEYHRITLLMIIITTMLLSTALISSFLMISVIFNKIFSFGLPKFNKTFSMFVPLGLTGQGGFSMLLICSNLTKLINNKGFEYLGLMEINEEYYGIVNNVIMMYGIYVAIALTSFGILLTVWGVLSIVYFYIGWPRIGNRFNASKKKAKAKKKNSNSSSSSRSVYWTATMWACTFPFGTIDLSMNELYKITGVQGFKIVAVIYAFTCVLITTWCMVCTSIYIIPWKKMAKVCW